MSSDTPRTDFEESDGWSGDALCVTSEFARQLERELNAAREENEKLKKESRIAFAIKHDLAVALKTGNPSATELHYAQYAIAELRERAMRAEDELALAREELQKELARLDWLSEHPESMPYLEDGIWRIPYLVNGDGGFGGGVGELSDRTLRGVVCAAMKEDAK